MNAPSRRSGADQSDRDEPRDPRLLAALAQAPAALDAPPPALSAALRQAAREAVVPARRPRSYWAWLDIVWRQPMWATGVTAAAMAAVVLGLWWPPRAGGPDGELPAIADTRVASPPAGDSARAVATPAAPASSAALPAPAREPAATATPARGSSAESPATTDKPRAPPRPARRDEARAAEAEAAPRAAEPAPLREQAEAVPPGAAPSPADAAAPSPAGAAAPSPAAVAAAPPAELSSAHPPPPQLAALIARLRETPAANSAAMASSSDAVIAERKRAPAPATAFAKLQQASGWRWTPPSGGGEVSAGSDAVAWLQRVHEAGVGRWQPGSTRADQADTVSRPAAVVTFTDGSAGPSIRITLSGSTLQWQDAQGVWRAELPPAAADALRY